MFWARKKLGVHSANCFMIGDRMDTDIVGGLESGMTTCLVLSGVTTRRAMERFPYQPDYIFNNVGEIDPEAIRSKRMRVESESSWSELKIEDLWKSLHSVVLIAGAASG
jgi:NagD protein